MYLYHFLSCSPLESVKIFPICIEYEYHSYLFNNLLYAYIKIFKPIKKTIINILI